MSESQQNDGRDVQQTVPGTEAPDDVLSVDPLEHSNEELAEMYESSRRTYSPKEYQRARARSLRGYTDDEMARRYTRAKGGPDIQGGNRIASNDSMASPPSITHYNVKEIISDEFGENGWSVMKAMLATHATLLLNDIESSRAMMVEGQSGIGKTMLMKTFGGLTEQFCRRSSITPASFVSAESSQSKDDLENKDLLPQLDGRTLAVRDAQTLFTGSEQTIRSRWSTLARIMDGDGYYRHSATHGKVGYDDIRFNFIGATTHLDPRAWRMMGNVGQRLLFVEWPEEDYEDGWLSTVVKGGERQPVKRGKAAVGNFLRDLWDHHGGHANVTWSDERQSSVLKSIEYLSKVVTYGRASLTNGKPQREAPKRIGKLLHDLARGNALIHGRTHIEPDDLELCSRVALSTIPSKRRSIIRTLLDPNTNGHLLASEIEDILGVSRPTARSRIEKVKMLELGEVDEIEARGGSTNAIRVASEFRWPNNLSYPDF